MSRTYFNYVNTSNTTVNNTTITNVYKNVNVTNVTYVNQQVPGAVIAMPDDPRKSAPTIWKPSGK